MRMSTLDPSLSGITIQDVARYLSLKGWKRNQDFPNKNLLLFENHSFGEPIQAVLPAKTEYRDFTIRLAELINTLSEIEEQTVYSIIQEIRHPNVDRIQLRVVSNFSSEGSLPLAYAATLTQAMKELVVGAACAEENPQPFYKRATKTAINHANICRFGQTKVGSFVVIIESPVPIPSQKTLFPDLDAIPFNRRVINRIQFGVAQIEKAVFDGDMNVLTENYKEGLNANMAEAILSLKEPNQDAILEYRVEWSPFVPKRENVPSIVTIEKNGFNFLESAARILRGSNESVVQEINGKVTRLAADDVEDDENDELENNRFVVIRAGENGNYRNIHLSLNAEAYKLACDAHRDSRSVMVNGTLERIGKRWVLMAPNQFHVE